MSQSRLTQLHPRSRKHTGNPAITAEKMAFRCPPSSIFSPRRKVSVSRVKSEPIDHTLVRDSAVAEEEQSFKCSVKTANNTRCSNHAKMYNEEAKMWVCGIHDNLLKASGICVICLEPMDTPIDRFKLECKHVYHKNCICRLELASCPCCRAPIMGKYAKKVFTNTKLSPLADKAFSLSPEKQKAFFSIADRLVEVLGDISDTDDGIGQIVTLKSYISTFSFGIQSLKQYNGDGLGIMEDWAVAATTAFGHIREYDTYDGLSFNADGINFWVDTHPPLPEFIPAAADRIITTEPPYIPIQPVQQPRDPSIAVNIQYIPVVQPGQLAQIRPATNTQFGGGFVPPTPLSTPVNTDMELDNHTAPYSPVSPSLIRL